MLPSRLLDNTRRDFLKLSAAGIGAVSTSGWFKILADEAAKSAPERAAGFDPSKIKKCVLLWMAGGPSHKDTFDLKPGSDGAGDFKPIKTDAPDIEISENFPHLAKVMKHGVVVRSMCTSEGAHERATFMMHTGYRQGVGGVAYPGIGSIASSEIGRKDTSLPNFVSIHGRSETSGFLGAKHQPLIVGNASKGLEELVSTGRRDRLADRVELLEEMEKAFQAEYGPGLVKDHKTTYERAVQLMESKEVKAFDVSLEPAAARKPYGAGRFADGCLLARRLVETGVPFVEVTLGGWDTHQDNFAKVKDLSTQVDAPMAALINDLEERKLLDSTLVIWMGEFGRTPKINTKGAKPGRDHYPKAWSLAMFGGGIKGGQVYGGTDKNGAEVVDKKVNAPDFLATVCELLGIDHKKKRDAPNGRPIAIVDKPNPFTKKIT